MMCCASQRETVDINGGGGPGGGAGGKTIVDGIGRHLCSRKPMVQGM